MRSILDLTKSTIIGGILFLLPLIIVIVIVEKAIQLARKVFGPLLTKVSDGSVLGVSLATIVSVVALLLLCLIAGLVARTMVAQKLVSRLEGSVLGRIPVYGFIKSAAEGITGIQNDENMRPVAVRLDDNTMIGLMTAEQEGLDFVAVYFPGAPTPLSGSVLYVERSRVTPLDTGTLEVFAAMKQLGGDSLGLVAATNSDTKTG
jgi:uncharacterized membrane protein